MSTPTFKLTVDSHELTLVEFDGVEELNRLFKYTFTTEIPTGVALASMIDGDATFTIEEYDTNLHTGDIDIPGYISTASKSNGYWVLEFSPKLLKTTTNSRAEIYFQEDGLLSASAVIDLEFQNDILLNDRSAVFEISPSLPTRKLFCQLHESNFNFVARLCDHWGFHFYFDHFLTQIVFADNNLYDQVFTTQLKTTSATADNSPLKIINWQEEIKAVESYTTVIGHDHANAGTAITASSPSDTTSQGSLTENRLTLTDVNSQAEADYIALVRQQSNNCMNHNASGESKVPYIFPGFLIDTDDSDFTKAFVVSTVSSGRNLNSANAGDASTYTCSFRAIPNSAVFRPTAHYQIPTATNVYGKIISETSNLSQAQRNQAGEYKVDLLGFENESSAHPWLRKTQTTAGSNSVDIPLLPDTEVLIAFADSNPNCPFILAAADNSLQPSPVTNANPHHAVIKTGGMLVTSSLEGRYNYAITSKTLEIDSAYTTLDSEISPSTKNYFAGRGKFDQHTNFIDPSSTSAIEFSSDDEGSGDYIFTRFSGDSVEIRQGDKMHWHNGNLYDFGGYWNYNLGNSYEENFIDQTAPLNIKVAKDGRSGDILTAGPNPGAISFSSLLLGGLDEDDVIPASYSNAGVATTEGSKTFEVNSEGAWDADGMNITKDYNATYDYKFGEGIEISDRVNSLEVTHTDTESTSIEMGFHNGVLRSWEKVVNRAKYEKSWNGSGTLISDSSSIDGVTEETNWHSKGSNHKSSYSKTTKNDSSITTDSKTYNINTGALATHNINTSDGMGKSEMDFSFATTAASKFNFGASTSFSIAAQADASLAISLTGGVNIKLEAGMNLEVKLSGGMSFEVEKALGGTYKIKDGWFAAETEATKLAATTAATLEAMGPTIQTVSASIVNSNAKLRKEMVTLDQSNVKLDTSYLVVFS